MRLPRAARAVAALLAALALAFCAAPEPKPAPKPSPEAAHTGIVLMHGKQGNPQSPFLAGLARALTGAGYLVELPEMCWSGRRIYDKPYPACLAEIDDAVARLKARGAVAIVIAGHSLGGSAALGYAARRDGIRAVVALAPAPQNNRLAAQPDVAASLEKARNLIAAGRGEIAVDLADYNNGRNGEGPITVHATPFAFASFVAPEGPGEIAANLPKVKAALLIVSGTDDRSQRNMGLLFPLAPENPQSALVFIHANHLATPQASIATVLSWLAALPPP
ncbi:MAG TPA: alpha/beta hydrolase [Stellaceae bacterium]|nr:alpha/beta hydrolase [Stellaceae bacterium]